MIWRIRFTVKGSYVHCRLFVAKGINMTFANCGQFTVSRGEEFASLMQAFAASDFIGDDEKVGVEFAIKEVA